MVRDESGINENKIESLTALRGIAFIGIFFLHTGFCIQWATLGVSTFSKSFNAPANISEALAVFSFVNIIIGIFIIGSVIDFFIVSF